MNDFFYETRFVTSEGDETFYFTVDYFRIEKEGKDLIFPPHLQRCFELITATEGEISVNVNGTEYTLKEGELLLVKPNIIHSFASPTHNKYVMCIFAPELIGADGERFLSYRMTSPIVSPNASDGAIFREMIFSMNNTERKCRIRSLLYFICDLFSGNLTNEVISLRESKNQLLLGKILAYVDENYSSDCSLSVLAEEINYSYTYLSKVFAEKTGMNYHAYVTSVRVYKALELLQNTEYSIRTVAEKCGWENVRSFNRSFLSVTGHTPSEYRS